MAISTLRCQGVSALEDRFDALVDVTATLSQRLKATRGEGLDEEASESDNDEFQLRKKRIVDTAWKQKYLPGVKLVKQTILTTDEIPNAVL